MNSKASKAFGTSFFQRITRAFKPRSTLSRFTLTIAVTIMTFFSSMAAVNAGYQKLEYTIVITPDHFPIIFPKRNADGDPVDYGESQRITAAELLNTDVCKASELCTTEAIAAGAAYYKVRNIPGVGDVIFYYDELGNLIGTQKYTDVVGVGAPGYNYANVGNANSNTQSTNPQAEENPFPTNHENYMVGTTSASFEVDPSGNANYSVPIVTPPAINGLQPEISLNYNSQGGNGLLGVGFSIGGLSVISRCPTTKAQDWPNDSNGPVSKPVNYSNEDAFCLDGQRLIHINSGTKDHGTKDAEYRTEIETFSRIKITDADAYGPKAFTVETKSGQTFIYDVNFEGTENINLRAYSDPAKHNKVAFLWPVKQISDISGQTINFTYKQNDGDTGYRPKQVSYGVNNDITINFDYYPTTRSDSRDSFSNGFKFRTEKLLEGITVKVGTHNVRQYRLNYEIGSTGKNRIQQIMECGDGSIGYQSNTDKCLPPITFDWTNGPTGLFSSHISNGPQWSNVSARLNVMDFNEDGYSDFVVGPSSSGDWRYIKGDSGLLGSYDIGDNLFGEWSDHGSRVRPMDVNGDGAMEMVIGPYGSTGDFWIMERAGDVFSQTTTTVGSPLGGYGSYPNKIYQMDMDGNGKHDLLFGPNIHGDFHAMKANAAGNGFDSYMDYIDAGSFGSDYVNLFRWTSPTDVGIWRSESIFENHIHTVDVDGNGLGDVLIGPNELGSWTLFRSTGTGFNYEPGYATSLTTGLVYTTTWQGGDTGNYVSSWSYTENLAKNIRFVDINGDGLQDMLHGPHAGIANDPIVNHGDWFVYINTGSGFTSMMKMAHAKYKEFHGKPKLIHPMDVDLDGHTDIVVGPDANGKWSWLRTVKNGSIYQFIDEGTLLTGHAEYWTNQGRISIGDSDGDGLAELILSPDSAGNWYGLKPNNPGHPDKIIGISNGPSLKTSIRYQLLTLGGSSFYDKGPNSVDNGEEKTITGPMLLVKSVSKGDGVGGVNRSSYYYEDLRTSLNGRGIQGFGKIIVTDESTDTITETHYAQKFPFTGSPIYSEKKIGGVNGVVVEKVSKRFTSKLSFNDKVYYPVNYENISKSYDLDTAAHYKTVTVNTGSYPNNDPCGTAGFACRPPPEPPTNTFPNLDEYGNVKWLETITKDETTQHTWTQTTESTYVNHVSSTEWGLGRLLESTVTHKSNIAGVLPVIRKSSFTYTDDTKRQLKTETVEPNSSDQTLIKTTTYEYDSYGLKGSVSEEGRKREDNGTFSQIIRFAKTNTNSVTMPDGKPAIMIEVFNAADGSPLQAKETTWTSRLHGGQIKHQGPNGKVSTAGYDELGRKIKETNSLNVVVNTEYQWAFSEPQHALYSITKKTEGIEDEARVYYDHLGREIKTTTRSLDGREVVKETIYDSRGLVDRANRPYMSGTTPVWICFEYDALGRVKKQNHPAANGGNPDCSGNRAETLTSYNGLVTTVTDPKDRIKIETKNARDKVTEVVEASGITAHESKLTYTHDAIGNLKIVKDQLGRETVINYDKNGRKTSMVDPTMGTWIYDHNSFDELVKQTDGKGQVITMQYDDLGRMIQRAENNGQDVWTWSYVSQLDTTSSLPIGKLKTITGPNGYSKSFTYTSDLQPYTTSETQTLPNGSTETLGQRFTYDEFGRVKLQINTGTNPATDDFVVENEYNRYGHLVAVKTPQMDISAEAQARLQAVKTEAETKAAEAEAQAEAYMSQAISYQNKAIEYENYAISLLRLEGYNIRINNVGFSDLYGRANLLYKAANDLRDISLIMADKAREKSNLAIAEAQNAKGTSGKKNTTGEIHRDLAISHAEEAKAKLEKAKYIIKKYKNGIVMPGSINPSEYSQYIPANSAYVMLESAEAMMSSAQKSYSDFQDQQALAERYYTYAEGINDDVVTNSGDTTWWRAAAADAEGRITKSVYGNGTTTERIYDPNTGHLLRVMTSDGVQTLQDLAYVYDNMDNVVSRRDNKLGYTESYDYDVLDRLETATIDVDGLGASSLSYSYNKVGDIKTLGDTTLVYDETPTGTGRLTTINGEDFSDTSTDDFDNNGNMLRLTNGRSVEYTVFNKPEKLIKGTDNTEFTYNSNRSRMLKVNRSNTTTVTKITRYFGGYEKITDGAGNLIEHRYQISAGGALIAVHSKTDTNPAGHSNYLHKDALGSTDLITDDKGGLVERLGYTPFGTRRDMSKLQTMTDFLSLSIYSFTHVPVITKRGFTGHEHIDEMDLIHMNGRVYDPSMGRFLSPDPHVQMPKSTQGFNRYAYVQNNPVKYTDPSGYFISFLSKKVRGFVRKYGRALMSIAIAVYVPGAWGAFMSGLASSGGDLKTAFIAGLTAYAFGSIHEWSKGAFDATKMMVHGTIGGIQSKLTGGSFKDGFLGSAISYGSSYAKIGGDTVYGHLGLTETGGSAANRVKNIAVAGVVGGVAASLGGGKFKNGAVSGAFSRLFNEMKPKTIREAFKDQLSKTWDREATLSVANAVWGIDSLDGHDYEALRGVTMDVYIEGISTGNKMGMSLDVAADTLARRLYGKAFGSLQKGLANQMFEKYIEPGTVGAASIFVKNWMYGQANTYGEALQRSIGYGLTGSTLAGQFRNDYLSTKYGL